MSDVPRASWYAMGGTCRNRGGNIHKRNDLQGWLHTTEDRKCPATYAEPTERPMRR